MDELIQALARIEAKLDTLISALAEDVLPDDGPDDYGATLRTLDGHQAGGERDQSQSL